MKEVADPRQACCWQGKYFLDAFKAIVTRLLFALHALLAIYRVTSVRNTLYWLLSVTFLGMVVETLYVLIKRRGQEWKWFQLSVLLFLCTTVPPIWIIELTKLERWGLSLNITDISKPTKNVDSGEAAALTVEADSLDAVAWTVLIEQALVVVIIIGRWLMPKGELTREQLSALLLTYLGTASDIIDFMSILFEPNIVTTGPYLYAVLCVWTLSLMQFPFVATVTKKDDDEKARNDESQTLLTNRFTTSTNNRKTSEDSTPGKFDCMAYFLETEMWSILVSVLMQDGPFFIMRLIAVFAFGIGTYTNYFFTAKNGMVLVLQVYRIISIYIDHKKRKIEKKQTFKTTAKLYANAFKAFGVSKAEPKRNQMI